MEAVSVKNLSFCFPEADEKILDNVSFTVNSGEFVTLCGLSGSGKTTLLRHLKPPVTPYGTKSGSVFLFGKNAEELSHTEQTSKIGFVRQSPENQLVTDKVWHELAFGLESLGLSQNEIRRRVAETASFFGIQSYYESKVADLSGGQKQLLCLASVMAMQPGLLILDEPTSQLDPIAAADFLACVEKINRELGVTVMITEHRLEGILPVSDRVLVLENGKMICDSAPADVGAVLKNKNSNCFFSLPAPMRIWDAADGNGNCPVTIAQGREWLDSYKKSHNLLPLEEEPPLKEADTAVALKNIWFRYEKNAPDILKNLSLDVNRGELLSIMGGNGTGKSTLLSVIGGFKRPYRGRTDKSDDINCLLLPQEPQMLLDGKTVYETLLQAAGGDEKRIIETASLCGISSLLNRHPFDLSGGETQKTALCKLLLLRPRVLLLDEPTKGLDARYKLDFAQILRSLTRQGTAVVMVSHDVEFCAKYSDRCLMMFNGELVAGGTPREFFSSNSFYVTAASRMSRGIIDGAVTDDDIIYCCTGVRQEPPEPPQLKTDSPFSQLPPGAIQKKTPFWRRLFAVTGIILLLCGGIFNLLPVSEAQPLWLRFGAVALPVVLLMAAFANVSGKPKKQEKRQKEKLPKRTIAALITVLLLIPLTIYIGAAFLDDQKYLFISLLIMLEAMLPFFLIFEGRRPQARELVLIAVLCAVSVAGRMFFAPLPQVKPVLALVIISGVALGGETGFVVGATSMLISNIYFGQGAWTPWQMFAAGIVGMLAGVLFKKGLFSRTRGALCAFGFMTTLIIYGEIMNFSSLILSRTPVNVATAAAFILQGLPFDLIHGFSVMAFLFFFAQPMLDKLDRIKTKYGLY